ncbi:MULTISPECIES: GntR family transcriptional regulator [Arsenicicoccus]|uniref:GntR family transcriptional regulator n=1 Tax=Arsenicicoccus TaxID=267408 RepID=UPI000422CE2C|nr:MULTISPECIES: GntR family transcriptional regulator [Arsenicicoccus]
MSHESMSERLRDELRARIVATDVHPGDLLLEKSLAEEYSVSKTPVREALQMLAVEGWVTVIPRRGYTVSSMGFHDIREVMELRRAVEPMVAAAAAAGVTAALVTDLEGLLEQQVSASEHAEAVRAASLFHRRIAAAARNRRAEATLSHLFDETTRAHALLPPLATYIAADSEHAAHADVLDAIRAADPAAAERIMRDHLTEAESAMIAAFYR